MPSPSSPRVDLLSLDPLLREAIKLRVRLQVSQRALALALGVSAAAITYWESGRNEIGLRRMREYLGALGATMEFATDKGVHGHVVGRSGGPIGAAAKPPYANPKLSNTTLA